MDFFVKMTSRTGRHVFHNYYKSPCTGTGKNISYIYLYLQKILAVMTPGLSYRF